MILTPLMQYSYWQVVLSTGRILSELDIVSNQQIQGKRAADWTLDLISTGDISKVTEIHLISPGYHPAILKITEPGTAFQFKNASVLAMGETGRQLEAQIIGRVDDKVTGACTCYIWDRVLGLGKYGSNINRFGTWRPGIAPIGALSQEVMGLKL